MEVEIIRVEDSQEAGLKESELDEMWSYVSKKSNPRWLWHAIDRRSGKVLAYVFGRRKDEVFLQLKSYWSHLESDDTTRMDGALMNDIYRQCATR